MEFNVTIYAIPKQYKGRYLTNNHELTKGSVEIVHWVNKSELHYNIVHVVGDMDNSRSIIEHKLTYSNLRDIITYIDDEDVQNIHAAIDQYHTKNYDWYYIVTP